MTITTNDDRDEYTATSGQTVFNYTFKIYTSSDLNVYQTPSAQDFNDSTDLITGYSVTNVGDPSGGTITLSTGATNGDRITIVSAIPSNRTTDYQENGDFDPNTVNDDFDRSVSLAKQAEGLARRSPKFSESRQGVSEFSLPQPIANTFWRVNSSADGMEAFTATGNAVTAEVPVADYAALRALTSANYADDQIITVANGGTAGPGVVRTGTVTDNGFDLIVFTDDPGRHWQRTVPGDTYYAEWAEVNPSQIAANNVANLATAYARVAAAGGGTLVLPAGECDFNADIFWSSSIVNVVGYGHGNPAGSTDQTTINFTTDSTLYIGRSDAATNATVFGVTIGDFAVTGSGTQTGRKVQIAADRSTIHPIHCDVGDFPIHVEQAVASAFHSFVAKDGADSGLVLQPLSDGFFVNNNTFYDMDLRGNTNFGLKLIDAASRAVRDNKFINPVIQANDQAVSDDAVRTVYVGLHNENNTTLNGIVWGSRCDEPKIFGANNVIESGTRPLGTVIVEGQQHRTAAHAYIDTFALTHQAGNDIRLKFDTGDTNQQLEINKGSTEEEIARFDSTNFWRFTSLSTVAEGNAVFNVTNPGIANTLVTFDRADGSGFNGAASAMKIRANSGTSRSINAAGTVNASGADYAEYMLKDDDCGEIQKGDICGITKEGLLTDKFDKAIKFVIKSTDPSYVGNDVYTLTDEKNRSRVDRIAFCGQVPVNAKANPGDHLIPKRADDGSIACYETASPTLEEYLLSVGQVINDDNTIIVKL